MAKREKSLSFRLLGKEKEMEKEEEKEEEKEKETEEEKEKEKEEKEIEKEKEKEEEKEEKDQKAEERRKKDFHLHSEEFRESHVQTSWFEEERESEKREKLNKEEVYRVYLRKLEISHLYSTDSFWFSNSKGNGKNREGALAIVVDGEQATSFGWQTNRFGKLVNPCLFQNQLLFLGSGHSSLSLHLLVVETDEDGEKNLRKLSTFIETLSSATRFLPGYGLLASGGGMMIKAGMDFASSFLDDDLEFEIHTSLQNTGNHTFERKGLFSNASKLANENEVGIRIVLDVERVSSLLSPVVSRGLGGFSFGLAVFSHVFVKEIRFGKGFTHPRESGIPLPVRRSSVVGYISIGPASYSKKLEFSVPLKNGIARFVDVFKITNALVWKGEWQTGIPLPFDADVTIIDKSLEQKAESALMFLREADHLYNSFTGKKMIWGKEAALTEREEEEEEEEERKKRGERKRVIPKIGVTLSKAVQPLKDFYLEIAISRVMLSRRTGTLSVDSNLYNEKGELFDYQSESAKIGEEGKEKEEESQRSESEEKKVRKQIQTVVLGEGKGMVEIDFVVETHKL